MLARCAVILIATSLTNCCCLADQLKASSSSPLTTTLQGTTHSHRNKTGVPADLSFSVANNTRILAQVGSTAVLRCPALNVGENTVSWIRKRDYHLLTVGVTLYSRDQRYQVRYIEKESDWQLHIRYVQKHDEGIYECQVSSHPPMSLLTALDVLEATSEILGGPEKYLRTGSSLRLVCVLRKTTQPPSYVFWYLDRRMINYDPMVRVETSGDVSVLFLNNLGPDSSGNYTCEPSNARPSVINIHILRGGEMPAAIHSSAPSTSKPSSVLLLSAVLYLLFNVFSYALYIFISTGLCNSGLSVG